MPSIWLGHLSYPQPLEDNCTKKVCLHKKKYIDVSKDSLSLQQQQESKTKIPAEIKVAKEEKRAQDKTKS